MWLKHHVFRHHTYTGDAELDPDAINFKPYIRKTPFEPVRKYAKIPKSNMKLFSFIYLAIFPGMLMG